MKLGSDSMIIVVVGPTGVGKTKMSIELAKKYNGIVINGDSMQVYRHLNIGTAKILEDEKEGIPHFLFDIVDPDEMYTVYDYQKDLREILKTYANQNIIIVGGTGLYIKAGLFNYEFASEDMNDDEKYNDLSNEELMNMVLKIDPDTKIHQNNRRRLIRRLNQTTVGNNGNELLYDAVFIGVTTDRENLYNRINKRVDIMIEDGLVDEVKKFYDQGIRSKAIMTGIGYKELYDYFDGNISLDEAIDLIKKRTRKYAKRQYTWFNHQLPVKWFNVDFDDFSNTVREVCDYIDAKDKPFVN